MRKSSFYSARVLALSMILSGTQVLDWYREVAVNCKVIQNKGIRLSDSSFKSVYMDDNGLKCVKGMPEMLKNHN